MSKNRIRIRKGKNHINVLIKNLELIGNSKEVSELKDDKDYFPKEFSLSINKLYLSDDNKISKITIAYWNEKIDEEWDLVFVGSRPFAKDVNQEDFFNLVKLGQEFINQVYKIS